MRKINDESRGRLEGRKLDVLVLRSSRISKHFSFLSVSAKEIFPGGRERTLTCHVSCSSAKC